MKLAKKIGGVIFSTMTIYAIVTVFISVNAITVAVKALEEQSSKLLAEVSHQFILQLVESKTKSIELEVELIRSQLSHAVDEFRQTVASESNNVALNDHDLSGFKNVSFSLVKQVEVYDLAAGIQRSPDQKDVRPIDDDKRAEILRLKGSTQAEFVRSFEGQELQDLWVRFPIQQAETLRFVVEVQVNMDQFLYNILSDDDLKYFRYFLINDKAQLIASDNSIRGYLKSIINQVEFRHVIDAEVLDVINRVTAGEFGIAGVDSELGKVIVGFAPIEGINWRLAIVVPENYMISSSDQIYNIIGLATDTVLQRMLVGTLLFSALLAIVLSLLAKHITTPIAELEKWANKVISGHFSIDRGDVKSLRSDEFGRLQRAFIYMSRHVSDLVNGLEHRVEERTRELRDARDKAEKVNQAKTRFLANVSHELRTPLNAIIGFSEILNEQDHSVKNQHLVGSIASSGKNLLYLVNDLLDLTKIDENKLDIIMSPTSLSDIAKGLESTFSPQAKAKGVALKVNLDAQLPTYLLLDPIRLNQVLTNLISNAVKYTDQGSISLDIKGKLVFGKWQLSFCVVDTGRGIPDNELETIFDVFEQVESRDALSGTGLGLAIVKRLVVSMKGEINVNSEVGIGSHFCFNIYDVSMCEADSKLNKPSPVLDTQKLAMKRVLVVDDISFNRDVLRLKLDKLGVEVCEAKDGLEALDIIQTSPFDLILTDISMPNMDGIELSQIVKAKQPRMPVVAITARGFIQEEQEIRKYCDDYLRKPIEDTELLRVLTETLC